MSDFQREFLKAKLAKLPRDPPMPRNAPPELFILEEDDEPEVDVLGDIPESPLTDDSSSASSASSTSTIRPNIFARPQPPRRKSSNLEPISWNAYFSLSLPLTSPETGLSHHVYLTPPTSTGPLFVTHHGAGSSGLSFALLASEIRKLLPSAGILSLDARGHGKTTLDATDLSLSTLSADLINVINLTKAHCKWEKLPDIILVGHSLGGGVIVEVVKSRALGDSLLGYAVLDVVEGSAIDALQTMQTYLSTRPSGFASLSQGIEWHIRSRTLRNPLSARISVPALLHSPPEDTSSRPWGWRTDLAATQPFWESWFVGLSSKFLGSKGGKLLILAGTDRLDRELMIGQMQGKYQLLVLPECGHFVHEDAPGKCAATLVEFYKRNDRSALVLPPKVSPATMWSSVGNMQQSTNTNKINSADSSSSNSSSSKGK